MYLILSPSLTRPFVTKSRIIRVLVTNLSFKQIALILFNDLILYFVYIIEKFLENEKIDKKSNNVFQI